MTDENASRVVGGCQALNFFGRPLECSKPRGHDGPCEYPVPDELTAEAIAQKLRPPWKLDE